MRKFHTNSAKYEAARAKQERDFFDGDQEEHASPTSAFDLALLVQSKWHTVAVFCHGLLAGVSACHVFNVYMTASTDAVGSSAFLKDYQTRSQAFNSFYYFTFALCLLSTLDRYDVASWQWPSDWRRAFTFQNGAVAILIYVLGLTLTAAMSYYEDLMATYNTNLAFWSNIEQRTSHIEVWKRLSLVRAICAGLGWIVVALRPATDRLSNSLKLKHETSSNA